MTRHQVTRQNLPGRDGARDRPICIAVIQTSAMGVKHCPHEHHPAPLPHPPRPLPPATTDNYNDLVDSGDSVTIQATRRRCTAQPPGSQIRRGCILVPHRVILVPLCLCAATARAQITGGTFDLTGSDTVPRYFHAAGALDDGTVMVSGGLYINFLSISLVSREEISFHDPVAGTFSDSYLPLNGGPAVTPTLNVARSGHTQTTLLDGRVLITGGNRDASGTSPGPAFNGVEIFDPFDGSVSLGPPMSVARAMHTATLLTDGRVVIAGGASWQRFDPLGDSLSIGYSLARTRTAHAAVLLADFAGNPGDDRVLLIGGSGTGPNTLELIDPAAGTSSLMTSTLATGLDDLAATVLPDGTVFIVGGQDTTTGDTVNTTYLFDPVADVIASGPPVPNRPGGIADQEIVGFGRYVAIFGGEQQLAGTDTELSYAAIYDSALNEWYADGDMLSIRDDLVAVPLDDCSALLIDGGIPLFGQEAPIATCEIFRLDISGGCRPGDLDNDGDIDTDDYLVLFGCLTGPAAGPTPDGCEGADLDLDGDVDLLDFADWTAMFDPA